LRVAGKTVLILNEYGFPGGSITESLSCLQKIKLMPNSPYTLSVIQKVKKYKPGLLKELNGTAILNPESVKFALQKSITETLADYLFHVKLIGLEKIGNRIHVKLSGKEGKINLTCDQFIDASDEHSVTNISEENPKLDKVEYNLICTKVDESVCKKLPGIQNSLTLEDRRVYLNFRYDAGDSMFLENNIHEQIAYVDNSIREAGGRIQLLPARANFVYKNASSKTEKILFDDIDQLIGQKFNEDEIFLKACMVENLDMSE
jgi:hypothetical protein